MPIRQTQLLPLLFAGALCGGCALYLTLWLEPTAVAAFTPPILCAGVLLLGRYVSFGSAFMALLIIAFGFSTGVAVSKWRADNHPPPFLTAETEPSLLEGWVSAVEPGRSGLRLRIRPHAMSGVDPSALPEHVRVTHRLSLNVQPGRFVRCFVVLRPPPGPSVPGDGDFRRRAWFEGLGAVGYVRGRCRGGVLGAPSTLKERVIVRVGAWRRTFGAFVNRAAGPRAGGFAAALVSGDRSYMSLADQEALRASGLAHLLAISGLHMGIVGGLVFVLFRRGLALIAPLALRYPVQKLAAIAAIVASLIYLVLSGASVSTQRAFIMSLVVFTAILVERPALSLRSFTIALCLVAILHPQSVVSPGFQMSFAATGVLIAIYEAWSRRRSLEPHGPFSKPVFFVQSLIVTSVAASLATLPFAIYHFDRAAPLGILANLVAMPIVSLLVAPLAGLSLVLTPFGGAALGLRFFGWSLELVLDVAHFFTAWGGRLSLPDLPIMPGATLLLFCGAIGSVVALEGAWRRGLSVGLVCAGSLFWASHSSPHLYWAPSGDVFIARQGNEAAQRIEFVEGEGLSPLRYINLETGRDCLKGCSLRLGDYRVALVASTEVEDPCVRPPYPDMILTLSAPGPPSGNAYPCAPVLSWSAIAEHGGASIKLRGHRAPLIQYTQPCSRRPWYPCSEQKAQRVFTRSDE